MINAMKTRAKIIFLVFGGLVVLWLIGALFVSWSETDRIHELVKEKNELLLREQSVSQKLRLQLDSCRQH
jgi:regulatory protein YycI of two-component signal transduction system YycFG